MPFWRRAFSFLLPSLAAAVAGAVAAGLVDGALNTYTPLQAFAAAGFSGVYLIPIGFVGALAARGLWHAWRFRDLTDATVGDTGGSPRMAAWLLYLLIAGWLLMATTFNAVALLMRKTVMPDVVALVSAIIVIATAATLALCSRPAVRGFTYLLNVQDRRWSRNHKWSWFSPRRLIGESIIAVGMLAAGVWFVSISPRIGHLDLTFLLYLGLYVAVLIGIHVLWRVAEPRRMAAGVIAGVTAFAGGGVLGAAYYARHNSPYAMLEVWGNTEIAGPSIDLMYDVQSLRGDLDMGEFAPEPVPGKPHHDVVLITIDTVRADRTPIYGGRAKMPALSALAKESTVFDWAFSPGNVTRRSLPTIATGLSPGRIRGRIAGWALRLDPRHIMVAERFRAAGYDTAGFFCCGSQFASRHRLGLIRGIDYKDIEKDGNVLTDRAVAWLTARERTPGRAAKPLFLWFHYIEPHLWDSDYPSNKFGGNKRLRYDMSLEAVDRMLAKLFKVLRTDERIKTTYVVLTSDHGEGLGDHGSRFHSTDVYNSQIHVPLVIAGPDIEARRVLQPVGLVSLAPTLLDLAGFVPPGMPDMDGESIAPILRGQKTAHFEDGVAYSTMVKDRSVKHGMRALIVGRYKLIERDDRNRLELYDIVRDRAERRNLAKEKPEIFESMKKRMAQRRALDSIPPF